MSHYFVAGGVFWDANGTERFSLLSQRPGEKLLVMGNGLSPYFNKIWHHAHLYRVENDLSLTLIAASPIALRWGVGAPEKVRPQKNWIEKLQAIISLS